MRKTARHSDGSIKNGIARLPSWLPMIVLALGIVGSGVLGLAVWARERSLVHERTEVAARALQNELVARMLARVHSLELIADRWRRPRKPNQPEFESLVSLYGGPFSGYFMINWVDPSGQVRWAGPGLEGKKIQGYRMTSEARRKEAWLRSRTSRQIRVTRVLELLLGGRGFCVYVPAFDRDQFYGHIVGVFRLKELLGSFVPGEFASQGAYSILVDGEEVYASGHLGKKGLRGAEVVLSFDIYGSPWTIRAVGRPAGFFGRCLFSAVFGFGVVLSILLAWLFHLFQRTAKQSIELTELNESLEDRVSERTAALDSSRAKLQALAEELRASNAELEQFASIASHDLREPLRGIGSYVGLLRKKYRAQLDDDANRYIQNATDGVHRMMALIDALLSYAHLGKSTRRAAIVDGKSVVEQALANLAVAIRDAQAQVTVREMPVLEGDFIALVQLFQNLIGNAVKYRRKEEPRIEISSTRRGSDWVFEVRDNGIGFPMEFRDRIFEAFRRLHGPREFSGVGLGLAVCAKIVARHGGRIWAESVEGKGSTFSFAIPVCLETVAPLPNHADAPIPQPCANVHPILLAGGAPSRIS